MTLLPDQLHLTLSQQLQWQGWEISQFLPIPSPADPLLLSEQILNSISDFSKATEGPFFLLQVKPKNVPLFSDPPSPHAEKFPNGHWNSVFLLKNADLLKEAKEYALAKKIYQKLLRQTKEPAPLLWKWGQCEEGLGRFKKAMQCYEEALSFENRSDFYQSLVQLQIQQKEWNAALLTLERALLQKTLSLKEKAFLHQKRGDCWIQQQEWALAKESFLEAEKTLPANPSLCLSLGDVSLKLKAWKEAQSFFHKVLSRNPQHPLALFGLGLSHFHQNQKKEALQFFIQSLDQNLLQPSALFYLVQCAYELHSYSETEKKLSEWIQKTPFHPDLSYSLAGLQFQMGKREQAFDVLKKILKEVPNHSPSQKLFEKIQKISLSETSFFKDPKREGRAL